MTFKIINKDINRGKISDNHVCNILRPFDRRAKFPLITSETKHNYLKQMVYTSCLTSCRTT